MTLESLEADLNEMTAAGNMIEALTKHYAESCTFQEGVDIPREGRQTQIDFLSGFFASLKSFQGATLAASTVGSDVTMSEWEFRMLDSAGEPIVWNEILVRRWKDGKVVSERFYQA